MRAITLLLIIVGASARPAHAAAACPQSCTQNVTTWVCTTDAARDSSGSEACVPSGILSSHASYDLVTGHIDASAQSCSSAPYNGSAWVIARDRFRLIGPSSGSPIAFEARLSANGSAGGNGTVSAQIHEVGGDARNVHDNGQGGFIAVLVLPLSHLVGEEFELVYEINTSAESGASAHGALSFAGMPTGYGVASCQGFAGDGAVSIRRASWGALKLHYR